MDDLFQVIQKFGSLEILERDDSLTLSMTNPEEYKDRKEVFLTYWKRFQGVNGLIRQRAAIRNLFKKSGHPTSEVKDRLGVEKVVVIIQSLLEEGLFSDSNKAKRKFPELYPGADGKRERLEETKRQALNDEDDRLSRIESEGNKSEDHLDTTMRKINETATKQATKETDTKEASETKEDLQPRDKATLDDIIFSFNVQYAILEETQKLLEQCCFDFTRTYHPQLLVENRWDCPESIELNRWAYIMKKRHAEKPDGNYDYTYDVLQTLTAVVSLRHDVVHRTRVEAIVVLHRVQMAVNFTKMLQDAERASLLMEILTKVENKIEDQKLKKHYLEARLKQELDEIGEERRRLEQREKRAISTTLEEDRQNIEDASASLQHQTRAIFERHGQNVAGVQAAVDDSAELARNEHNGGQEQLFTTKQTDLTGGAYVVLSDQQILIEMAELSDNKNEKEFRDISPDTTSNGNESERSFEEIDPTDMPDQAAAGPLKKEPSNEQQQKSAQQHSHEKNVAAQKNFISEKERRALIHKREEEYREVLKRQDRVRWTKQKLGLTDKNIPKKGAPKKEDRACGSSSAKVNQNPTVLGNFDAVHPGHRHAWVEDLRRIFKMQEPSLPDGLKKYIQECKPDEQEELDQELEYLFSPISEEMHNRIDEVMTCSDGMQIELSV